MKKGCLIIFGLLTLICIIGAFLAYRILITPFTPHGISIDKNKYPVTGIDISGHTGIVKFEKILAQDIDFVYLKATEGNKFVDPKFNKNYRNAKKSGIPVGFYHFFKFNKDGKFKLVIF